MRNRLARLGSVLLSALVMVGVAVAAAPSAAATHEGTPTSRELLNECNAGRTTKCAFRPEGMSTYAGPRMLAGSGQNCGSGTDVRVLRWEASSTTTNSWGVEISAKYKLGEAFESSFTTTYSRQWGWTDSQSDEYRAELKPRTKKVLYASKLKTKVSGTWELNFKKRYKGHYIWYVSGGEVAGQTKGSPWDITAKEEKASC
ncbi:hypothetical protein ACWEIJ_45445 [Lentzea sp. NPDC004789]